MKPITATDILEGEKEMSKRWSEIEGKLIEPILDKVLELAREHSNPTEVVKDTKYPNMYRLKWKDGVLSKDFYNLTRAKEHLRKGETPVEVILNSREYKISEAFIEARGKVPRNERGQFSRAL